MKNKNLFIFFSLFCFLFLTSSLYSAIVDRIVAKVGNEVILLSELKERVSPILEKLPKTLSLKEREEKEKDIEKRILEEMVEEKLFLVEAEKKNYKVDEESIEKELGKIKKKFPSEEEFFKQLKEEGKNISQLKEDIRKQLLIREVIRKEIISKVKVTEEEVKSFYEKYKKDLSSPPEVNISQIFIKNASTENMEKTVNEVKERLKKGEDFYLLARKFSDGPLSKEGGRIGFIQENQLLPEVRLQLKTLKVGEISPPIKCEDGYRFIKLEGVKESHVPLLKEVRNRIESIIFRKKTQESLEKWIKKARDTFSVEVNL